MRPNTSRRCPMNAANRGTRARPTAARLRVPFQIEIVRLRAIRNVPVVSYSFRINYLRVAPAETGRAQCSGRITSFWRNQQSASRLEAAMRRSLLEDVVPRMRIQI